MDRGSVNVGCSLIEMKNFAEKKRLASVDLLQSMWMHYTTPSAIHEPVGMLVVALAAGSSKPNFFFNINNFSPFATKALMKAIVRGTTPL